MDREHLPTPAKPGRASLTLTAPER